MHAGVLAFQGDVAEHINALTSLNVDAMEIRTTDDLQKVSHLILPGGESTVMSSFLFRSTIGDMIIKRAKSGDLAIFGTCAGAILLATQVTGKHPPKTLGLLDMTIERNAYGTQRESFAATLDVEGMSEPMQVAFIRAPKISKVDPGIQVLAMHGDELVIVRSGRILAATCHPELRSVNVLHKLFLSL